jgi:hypothetical protein
MTNAKITFLVINIQNNKSTGISSFDEGDTNYCASQTETGTGQRKKKDKKQHRE